MVEEKVSRQIFEYVNAPVKEAKKERSPAMDILSIGGVFLFLLIGIPVTIAVSRIFGFNSTPFWVIIGGLFFWYLMRRG